MRISVVPNVWEIEIWFPLGLSQWDQQLQATYVRRLQETLLPACPYESNDLVARLQELNGTTQIYSHSFTE